MEARSIDEYQLARNSDWLITAFTLMYSYEEAEQIKRGIPAKAKKKHSDLYKFTCCIFYVGEKNSLSFFYL
jgi:nucleoside-specific outer membrane channel protein Tsx